MSRPPRPLIGLNTSLTVGESGERHISVPADYVQALVDAGGIPLLVSPLLDRSAIAETLRHMQGILFIGGQDYWPTHYGGHPQSEDELLCPLRDQFDFAWAEAVLNHSPLPVLAICGGMQLLALARGGKLIQDITTEWHPPSGAPLTHGGKGIMGEHEVTIMPQTLLAHILEVPEGARILTNSAHHQAVHPLHPGQDLSPAAVTDDGIVEAIVPHPNSRWGQARRFILGVQWHPERISSSSLHQRIFAAFIAASQHS